MAHLISLSRIGLSTCAGVLFGMSSAAFAQVSVDMRALDQLGPSGPPSHVAPPPARPEPAPQPAARRVARASHAAPVPAAARPHAAPKPTAPGADEAHAAPKQPSPNAATPPPAVISDVPALPTARPAEPPPSTLVPAPTPGPQALPPPVRLVFDTGQTDLTPANEAAIRDLAHEMPAPDASSINVVAYAAGKPDDASTARRLSLSRGLAVRAVLLASGVPSAQIYVRALGATATDGPADRVELIVTRLGTVTR